MSDYELFHPPFRQPDGNLQPNPNARYLTVAQITEFAQQIRGELKELGGMLLINKVEHLFRTLDGHIGEQMKADNEEALRREQEAKRKETEEASGAGGDVIDTTASEP
jgi:hypothetical protein